ncbi:hypothetical protein CfE428DRAFT_1745 [Chthoniobacter flavus Ellin428]|uniref:LITAF domain-containing protein n=1 Tax=Chthoniobacter flavus Ellin428 TaxID=497964 RepID=B4CYK7_9BACT|nr:hypothetical protein [Chthoniobacter flavus]EDY20548.1 hypothetical protein CfE428DRAFT_1745 [Chthoniobacter flavus Ellin428]
MKSPPIECPACRSTDVHACGKRYGLYPAGPLAIFGVAFAMLHQTSRPFDYRCKTCGQEFARRTPIARVVRWLFIPLVWFFVIAFGLGILSLLFRR